MTHFSFSRGGVLVTSHLHSVTRKYNLKRAIFHLAFASFTIAEVLVILHCYVQSIVFGTNLLVIAEQLTFLLIHKR